MTQVTHFEDDVKSLHPYRLNVARCAPHTSLFQRIKTSAQLQQTYSDNQQLQFNLGNQQTFTNPFQAADYLLKREYGDTYLYGKNPGVPVFTPPFFASTQMYYSDVSMLTNNVKKEIERTSENASNYDPDHWFTGQIRQLDEFIGKKESENEAWIKKEFKAFLDTWMCKMKLLHLLSEYGSNRFDVNMRIENYEPPDLMECEFPVYFNHCLKVLDNTVGATQQNIQDELAKIKKNISKQQKLISKKHFKKILKDKPLTHTTMQFLNNVELSHISGEQAERWLFESLTEFVHGDFTVLHSCDFYTEPGQQKHQEIDFLMFSATRKIIIAIEAKASLTKDFHEFKQLERYRKIFEENFGDRLDNEWQFIPVLFVNDPDSLPEESSPSRYVITRNTNIPNWFQDISNLFPEKQNQNGLEQLKDVLKLLVFVLHFSRTCLPNKKKYGPLVTSNISEYVTDVIDTISSPSNIIFYSNQQLQLLTSNEPRFNKVYFYGLNGTGKTILLREKAEMLAKTGEKVAFIFGGLHARKKTLLQIQLEERWSDPIYKGNIETAQLKDVGRIKQSVIGGVVKHVLIDEFNGDPREDLFIFAAETTMLWVVLPYHSLSSSNTKTALKSLSFTEIRLSRILRNCKRIVDYKGSRNNPINTDNHRLTEIPLQPFVPENVPEGVEPITIQDDTKSLEHKIRTAYKKMACNDRSIIFLLRFNVKNPASIQTIEYVGQSNGKTVKCYFDKMTFFTNTETPLEFLKDAKSVLITDTEAIEGFEWPNVIVCFHAKDFAVSSAYAHNTSTSCFTRSTTNLIVVDDDTKFEDFFTSPTRNLLGPSVY